MGSHQSRSGVTAQMATWRATHWQPPRSHIRTATPLFLVRWRECRTRGRFPARRVPTPLEFPPPRVIAVLLVKHLRLVWAILKSSLNRTSNFCRTPLSLSVERTFYL